MEQTNPSQQEKRVVASELTSDQIDRKRHHSSGSDDEDALKVRKIDGVVVEEAPLKNVPLFLIISHREEGKNLSKVSPFLINKSLVGVGGQPAAVRKLRSGQILVEASNRAQALRFLKMTSFFGQFEIKVEPHSSLNPSKGIIFCRELMECSIEEIKEELEGESVTEVVRIRRRENEKEILKIATLEKLSFFDARKELRKRHANVSQRVSASVSYSQAVSATPQPSQCSSCSKLEGMVQALTEQVSALVNLLSSSATLTQVASTAQTFASADSNQTAASSSAAHQPSTLKQVKPVIIKKTGATPKSRPSPPAASAEDRKKLAEKLKKTSEYK